MSLFPDAWETRRREIHFQIPTSEQRSVIPSGKIRGMGREKIKNANDDGGRKLWQSNLKTTNDTASS
mgnify:CR=1 FL=1